MINNNYFGSVADASSHRLGNYRIVRALGHGGFASVFLGEHLYLKRLAAIKVLRTALAEKEQARFLEEARLLANLSHPHIVRVLEFAVAQRWTMIQGSNVKEHIPFLVMDYAPGGNLRALYPPGMRLSLDTVVNTIKQVAEALQYAHDHRVIHRDIKPENLLISEQREVMLSDFGLALFAPSLNALSLQGIAGTLPYTAPEQLQGKPSFASDQYSLGILAYEWLCGSRPFDGQDIEIIMHHISSSPPRPRSKNLAIPQAVEDVLLKALAKDPQQRYQSVQAFARALEEASRVPVVRPVTGQYPTVHIAPFATDNEFPAFRYFAQKAASEAAHQGANFAVAGTGAQNGPLIRTFTSLQRNRVRMLQKVRAFWVNGVLKDSLRGAAFIPVGLDERQDAVASPWSANFPQAEGHSRALAQGTSITEVYDQAGGELLILGEPGSGKTTLLLELTRHLLNRAEHDETAPIPVVFLLSAWAAKQLPLEEWLIGELKSKYQVPYALGELWVRNEMILPLLDGLDEVEANIRSACVIAINTYKKTYGLSSLVVCSRLTEYLLYPPRIVLHSAVVIRPLTMQQIDEYLKSSGEHCLPFSQVIHSSLLLQQLVTTPLMLNIITLAFQDKSPEDFLSATNLEEYGQLLFSTYVEQMLHRHPTKFSHRPQQLAKWLGYLADQMQKRGQTVFYLEQIQPDWIENIQWMQFHKWFAVMLPGALIGALTGILCNVLLFHAGSIGVVLMDAVYGTVMGYMFSGRKAGDSPSMGQFVAPGRAKKPFLIGKYVSIVLFVGLITLFCMGLSKGWTDGLVNGAVLGTLSIPLSIFIQRTHKAGNGTAYNKSPKPKGAPFPSEHLKVGVLAGLACGVTSVVTILVTQGLSSSSVSFLLSLYIRDSLRNALLGTLLSVLLVKNDGIIHRAEILSWSWRKFWQSFKGFRHFFLAILFGLVIAVIFASKQLFQGNMSNVFGAGLTTGVLVVVAMHLSYALWGAVTSSHLDDRQRDKPNEGIRRSFFHSLLGGLIGVIVVTFCSIITCVIAGVLNDGLFSLANHRTLLAGVSLGFSNALLLAPIGGALLALLFGGLAFFQYHCLRFVLWCTGKLPLHLLQLLDAATASILLHKAGGGYLFIHRFLREYFASLDKKGPFQEKAYIFAEEERLVRHL